MDWTETKLTIERLELPDAQKANVMELLTVADVLPAPQEVTVNGYDGGLSLHWNGYEVAAYVDRYDLPILRWKHANQSLASFTG